MLFIKIFFKNLLQIKIPTVRLVLFSNPLLLTHVHLRSDQGENSYAPACRMCMATFMMFGVISYNELWFILYF